MWDRARGIASAIPLRVAAGAFLGIVALSAAVAVVSMVRDPSPYQPPPEALKWYTAGTEALRDGTYLKARRSLEQAVRVDDRFALAHARLAEAWAELGYNDRANASIGRARSLAPDISSLPAVDGLRLKAINDTLSRDLPAAIDSYARILERTPDSEKQYAYFDLGRAYEKYEVSANALENYAEAAKRDPQYAAAHLRGAILHARLKNKRESDAAFERAEALFQANSNLEGVSEVCYQRGALYNSQGKETQARPQLERALSLAEATENESQQIRALLQLGVASIADDIAKAREYAQRAIDLAQAKGMENLMARGLVDLGSSLFYQGKLEEAEAYFRKALDVAVSHDSPENEARARFSIGSLLIQTRKIDAGLPDVNWALTFFRNGGYRTETCQCLILIGRAKSVVGDSPGALQAFDEQRQVASELGDAYLMALAQEGLGTVHRSLERYLKALQMFSESYESSKSIADPQGMGYSALNRASALWRLGRYAEAEPALGEAEAVAKSPAGSPLLMAAVDQCRAEMALSRGLYREAVAFGEKSLAANGGLDPESTAESKRIIGLAQSRSGARREGKTSCAEAATLAEKTANPFLISGAWLALAEATLADADAPGALALATQAREQFEKLNQPESRWRSLALAAACGARQGDGQKAVEYAARAAEAWAAVKDTVGDEALASYMTRPDVARDAKTIQDVSNSAR
jgi:tetratricopeptide (TPR) repeat protein